MASLQLYTPINVLKPVATNIWIVDGPIAKMAYLGTHLPFTTRMTVIRLANGELFLHSPIRYDAGLAKSLEQLGPIKHLISPNRIHYEAMMEWRSRYPDSLNWASPGVRERAAAQNIAIEFDRDLGETPPPEWSMEIDQVVVRGSRLITEVVFFHRASRTAVLADLIENFETQKVSSPILKWLLKLSGSTHPDGKAPIDLRMTFIGNKKTTAQAIKKIIAWQPSRVVLSHGAWYETNGTDELRRAFRWLKPYL